MKQQNVTTISAEAELCRAINGHGDLQDLTDTGPWTARLLCPCFLPALAQREAPRVLANRNTLRAEDAAQAVSLLNRSITHTCLCCDWKVFSFAFKIKKLVGSYYKVHIDASKSSNHWFVPFRSRRDIPIIQSDFLQHMPSGFWIRCLSLINLNCNLRIESTIRTYQPAKKMDRLMERKLGCCVIQLRNRVWTT